MIGLGLVLLALGVFLSAFFSGSETGFYRASRVRIVIAGLDGDRIAKYLIRLINNPTLFVATTLIGNNVANYMTSLAIVLLAQAVTDSSAAEMLAPILLSPLLFVYGELLPKNLFFQAPNVLLRLAAPLILFFTLLFSPVAALLWGLGRGLERLLGQSPEKIRLTLARKELQQVLEDGLEAGILHPTQRHLGQGFFLVASRHVREICTPISRINAIRSDASREAALRFARQKEVADIPIYRGTKSNLIGYVRTVDLLIGEQDVTPAKVMRPLDPIPASELFGEAIMEMQSKRETLRSVVNAAGRTIGLLSIDQLTDPLLKGPLGSLRR